ncbi:DUF5134 domain-containing protein [Streptomyces purpureus]|uniref:DUF5134 domain-containing protein n=2 Tax=Streptomyces purpureus TaxID=1951 RepID=A0A918LVU7_9ACTN|nr:DUF5134 domain-containing protein [Streptomyces purpureus]
MAGWLLVVLCAAAGTYCLLRRHGCAGEDRRAAGGEALMAFGMAVMALPAAVVAQPQWAWLVYAVVFGAAAVRALWAVRPWAGRHLPHHLHHLMGSLAMVYMAVAMTGTWSGAGGAHVGHSVASGASGIPLLTGVLLLYYSGYVLRTGSRLVPVAAHPGGALAWSVRPELALACRLSMGMAMLAMLFTL